MTGRNERSFTLFSNWNVINSEFLWCFDVIECFNDEFCVHIYVLFFVLRYWCFPLCLRILKVLTETRFWGIDVLNMLNHENNMLWMNICHVCIIFCWFWWLNGEMCRVILMLSRVMHHGVWTSVQFWYLWFYDGDWEWVTDSRWELVKSYLWWW